MNQIKDVMTPNPTVLPATATVVDAARAMRQADVGDVLVESEGELRGIVTDRDIVVRAIADGGDPLDVKLGDIASVQLATLKPSDSVEDAVRLMREKALRRVPVCEGGRAVGIVSLGDLAIEGDGEEALADISAAPPNS